MTILTNLQLDKNFRCMNHDTKKEDSTKKTAN